MNTIKDLKILLANLWASFFNLRNAHWNIEANNFMELHKLFQSFYEDIESNADDIAEMIRQKGEITPATMVDYISFATIKNVKPLSDSKLAISINLASLQELYKQVIKIMQGLEKEDEATRNLLAGISQELQKKIWILNSFK